MAIFKARWKVVPICDYQKMDVHPEDLLDGGNFRKCETYRGGGGYDQFPAIAQRRLKMGYAHHKQFIAQLYGCNLDCPYCYVTRSGVWGTPIEFTTPELVNAFFRSSQQVFHLMGGAPAIYLEDWPEIAAAIDGFGFPVFHSDFLLTEKPYDTNVLADLADEVREPKPFIARDRDIVDETDRLIATPLTEDEEIGSGTWTTVRYARKKGKLVVLIHPKHMPKHDPHAMPVKTNAVASDVRFLCGPTHRQRGVR